MEIKLENIGIVKDSVIAMDGLTVITGKNNSGKTTVGKVVYSLLDAVCNINQKFKSDRQHYIQKQVDRVETELEAFRYLAYSQREVDSQQLLSNYPAIYNLVLRSLIKEIQRGELEIYARDLMRELREFDVESFLEYYDVQRFQKFLELNRRENNSISSLFEEQKGKAIAILEKMFVDIDKDSEMINYIRESINQTLRVEFLEQIQPIKVSDVISKVELSNEDSVLFSFSIVNNSIVNEGGPVFVSSPYRKVYFVDDPFILDETTRVRAIRDINMLESTSILNLSRICSHSQKLKATLRNGKHLSIFEQTVLDESLKKIKEQIDEVIPGAFDFSPNGEFYVQNGVKLKFGNLATGSKMFSIIKILLEKGEIDSSTMLVLDEPEAHLHPMWQNAFAEIIVMLVKELNVNVVLTTHSPNFMLAIDAYMRKYGIEDKTNFYQTDDCKDGFVQYHCVNDDMGKIYQDFLQYLSEVKMLRNQYLNNTEE